MRKFSFDNEVDAVEWVTPEKAREYLVAGNPKNRKMNEERVLAKIELQLSDDWEVSREFAVSFDETGEMLNGHTRMTATSRLPPGRAIPYVIRRGVSRRVLKYVDSTETQIRTNSQVGHMIGIDTRDDALIRSIIEVLEGTRYVGTIELNRFRAHMGCRDVADKLYRVMLARNQAFPTQGKAVIMILARKEPELAMRFTDELIAGIQRKAVPCAPIAALISSLEGTLNRGASQRKLIAEMTATAIVHYATGKKTKVLRGSSVHLDEIIRESPLRALLRSKEPALSVVRKRTRKAA